MNVDRILILADILDSGQPIVCNGRPFGFNMGAFSAPVAGYGDRTGRKCGTVGCIAGHAVALWGARDTGGSVNFLDAETEAASILGLDPVVASDLFYAENDCDLGPRRGYGLHEIPPKLAARVLRRLAKTGKVKWPVRLPKGAGK